MKLKYIMLAVFAFSGIFACQANPLPVVPDNIYITYYANGGSGRMPSQKVRYGRSVKLKANKFTRDWYLFAGWSTSPSASYVDYYDQETVNPYWNLALYAVWQYDAFSWMNKAKTIKDTLWCYDDYSDDEYSVGTITIKVGKRNKRTNVSTVSITAKFDQWFVNDVNAGAKRGKFPKTVTLNGKTSGDFSYGCTSAMLKGSKLLINDCMDSQMIDFYDDGMFNLWFSVKGDTTVDYDGCIMPVHSFFANGYVW